MPTFGFKMLYGLCVLGTICTASWAFHLPGNRAVGEVNRLQAAERCQGGKFPWKSEQKLMSQDSLDAEPAVGGMPILSSSGVYQIKSEEQYK